MNKLQKIRDWLRYNSVRRLVNRGVNRVEYVLRRNSLISYPSFLIVEPSNHCNLKCPLCPTGQGLETSRGTMKMEVFTRIVDQLHLYIRHMNLFYLGEPLICKDLPDMIKYAQSHKIRVSVSSNLNILDEGVAERIIESGLSYLIVSLDGVTSETYSKYRIGGDYETVVNNIKLLIKKKKELNSVYPRILIQFVIFKHNECEIEGIKELAKSLDVDVFFRQGALGGKGQSPPLGKDKELAEKWLTQDKKNQTEYDYFGDTPYLKPGVCEYLWSVATVNWDGCLLPCCWIYDSKHSFGNIMEKDFKEIWNDVYYKSARNLFNKNKDGSVGFEPEETICHKCKMFKHNANG